MTVYVDILIAVNIFVNYFLLRASELLLKTNVKKSRLVISAALGGLYSLVIFLPEMPEAVTLLMNLTASAIITVTAFSPKKVKAFLRQTAVFFLVNFIFAGAMLGIWLALRPSGMVFNNSIVYFNIDIKILTASTVVCYAVFGVISHFVKRTVPADRVFSVTFTNNDKSVTVNALLDTGNSLKDGFSGKPVIIANKNVLEALLGFSLDESSNGNDELFNLQANAGVRLIPYSTVGDGGFLRAFPISRVRVNEREITACNVLVAQSKTDFSSGEYQAILNNDFFERINENDKKLHSLTY